MDIFDPVRAHASPYIAYSRIQAHITLVGISTDWLFPPEDIRSIAAMIAAGARCDYREWPPTTATTPSSPSPSSSSISSPPSPSFPAPVPSSSARISRAAARARSSASPETHRPHARMPPAPIPRTDSRYVRQLPRRPRRPRVGPNRKLQPPPTRLRPTTYVPSGCR